MSPLWTCQQASCPVLHLLWPIFPLTECSGCCYASSDVVVNLPSASPPVKVVPAWFEQPLMAANFIYCNTPHVTQILNLGLLCFSAYHCKAFLPCTMLLFELLPHSLFAALCAF